MRAWKDIAAATGVDVYFRHPRSPWQRGINENTNGLLRQYFPKCSDLSVHRLEDLERVAAQLNGWPPERLGFRKPIELIEPLLRSPSESAGVYSTQRMRVSLTTSR
jgi:IS30 family transposase